MASSFDHARVRDNEDRGQTFALLGAVRSASTPEAERTEALRTRAHLEDLRSIGPLTAIVEDDELREPVRTTAIGCLVALDAARADDSYAIPAARQAGGAAGGDRQRC